MATEDQIRTWFTQLEEIKNDDYESYEDMRDYIFKMIRTSLQFHKEQKDLDRLQNIIQDYIQYDLKEAFQYLMQTARNQPSLVKSVLLSIYPELNTEGSDEYHGVLMRF